MTALAYLDRVDASLSGRDHMMEVTMRLLVPRECAEGWQELMNADTKMVRINPVREIERRVATPTPSLTLENPFAGSW